MATAHYLEALEWQKDVIKIHAILGSKNPHPQTFLVGGMAIPIDPDSQNALNADKLMEIKRLLVKAKDFVEKVYIPDLLAVASFYKEWAAIGGGVGNYLSYGEFPMHGKRPAVAAGRRHHEAGPRQGPAGRPQKDHRIRRPFLVRI